MSIAAASMTPRAGGIAPRDYGNSSDGYAIANQAENDMFNPNVQSPAQQCEYGLQSAKEILNDPNTTPTEKAMANATLDAYDRVQQATDNATSCVADLRACFDVMSTMPLGPVGPALGMVGSRAMFPGNIPLVGVEQCEIGLSFTHAIAENPNASPQSRNNAQGVLNQYNALAGQQNSLPQCVAMLGYYLANEANAPQ